MKTKGGQIMPNINTPHTLKLKNKQLEEDLIYYKNLNFDLRAKIKDLEDENRALKERIRNYHF